jgi:hypothetical protein
MLASLFAARRSGDEVLEALYRTRLASIGIRVVFTDPEDDDAPEAQNGKAVPK